MDIFIWVTLSPCQRLNSKLDIKDKEVEMLFYHKDSIVQECQFKLQLIDLRLKLLLVILDPSNQNQLSKSNLNLQSKKRKQTTLLFQKVERRIRKLLRKSQLLLEYHQHNMKFCSKLVFQNLKFQNSKKHNIG